MYSYVPKIYFLNFLKFHCRKISVSAFFIYNNQH